jgi:hypothetical protein
MQLSGILVHTVIWHLNLVRIFIFHTFAVTKIVT